MKITEVSSDRKQAIEILRKNAIRAMADLDSGALSSGIEAYKMHLKDCINEPTIGLIIGNEEKKFYRRSGTFRKNIKLARDTHSVKVLQKILEKKTEALYPRSNPIRKYIIKDERINSFWIRTVRGYGFSDIIKLLFK